MTYCSISKIFQTTHLTGTLSYSIIDWKTNKKIDKNSYNGKTGIKPPSYDLMDCKYTHHNLQISLYRYILENNYGLNVENLFLIHLLEDDYNEYLCDYMLDNIKQMLDYKWWFDHKGVTPAKRTAGKSAVDSCSIFNQLAPCLDR